MMISPAAPTLASDATQISWATATNGGGFQLLGENIAEWKDNGLRSARQLPIGV
jgi:hypothetical protein